jgi:hypothetical protein
MNAYEFIIFSHFVWFFDFAMFQQISYVFSEFLVFLKIMFRWMSHVRYVLKDLMCFNVLLSKVFFFLIVPTHAKVTHMCINVNNIQKLF